MLDTLEIPKIDLRSLLNLSTTTDIEAKEIGTLIAGRFSAQATVGHILELETGNNPQYLVRIMDSGLMDRLYIMYSKAEKLVTRIPNDKSHTYREENLDLDKSGDPTPNTLLAPIERKFRGMYAKDNAANKLEFI